jgi:guanylate kinase
VIALDGFLEYNDEYAGNAYGTLSPETTFCPLLEIDLVGVQKIKQLYPNARIVFITVPGATTHAKLRVLESRIIGRTENSGGVIDPNDLEKRLMRARQELDEGPALADVVITNLDPNEAASLLLTYIASVKL